MNTPHPLEAHEGPMLSDGACFPGSRVVFRGKDLHRSDLMELDYMGLSAFSISGLMLSKAQQSVLNSIFTITSYPDARLWDNRIAALAGTTRSTASMAISASITCSEAIIFGRQPMLHAADFLVRARNAMSKGKTLHEIVAAELKLNKHLGGYGRPVATLQQDERILILKQKMLDVGIDPMNPNADPDPARPLSYFALALEIEKILQAMGYRLTINYAGIMVAPPLDFGFTPEQCGLFLISCFQASKYPCYVEALERPPGASFLLRCSKINYTGKQVRNWDQAPSQ